MNVRLWSCVLAWALGAWAMTLLMSGGMAAVIFPTMKQLDPVLPAFVKVPQDHWSLAAGLVMRKVFFASDVVQLILATVSIVSLMVVMKEEPVAAKLRQGSAIALVVACLTMLTSAFWLSPGMRREMDRAMIAGAAGDAATMKEAREKFAAKHPISTVLLETTLSAVLIATICTGISMKAPRTSTP